MYIVANIRDKKQKEKQNKWARDRKKKDELFKIRTLYIKINIEIKLDKIQRREWVARSLGQVWMQQIGKFIIRFNVSSFYYQTPDAEELNGKRDWVVQLYAGNRLYQSI